MKKNNETKRNVYVQPVCKVVQVEVQQVIATSGGTERYEVGNTEDWFNN